MKGMRLTKEEKAIEDASLRGEYKPVPKAEFELMARAFARQRKDAVLHIRINSVDLANLKKKAKALGMPYQTFVAELLHRHAT